MRSSGSRRRKTNLRTRLQAPQRCRRSSGRSDAAADMATRVRATLIYLAKRGSVTKEGERATAVRLSPYAE
jgi:hypothetical protein